MTVKSELEASAKEATSREAQMSSQQLELTKATMAATAQITAAMVTVTNEKNPAKISEAFRVIYRSIIETIKPAGRKPPT